MIMRKEIHFVSAEEAVKAVKSGDHIHLSSVASVPRILIEALCKRGETGELQDVRIHHLHTEGAAPYTDPTFEGVFFHQAFFVGANVRKSVQAGYSDYIPGFVSLGPSVDATLAAIECAKTVSAVVNPNVPRAWGDAMIPIDMIDIFVEGNDPLEPAHFSEPNEVETAIGKHCAALIDDGACLQMGIGAIPNAVLAQLGNHKNLGVHTEMFADGVLELVEKGIINGSNKVTDKGKLVSTFLMGSQKCYDFIDDNPMVAMMDVGYTNDPYVISRNPKMTAINSAVQIDLTGQVCADSIGLKFHSGVGGQVDFIYGASLAPQGKAIIAMPSTTNKGGSKIAPVIIEGGGVVTTRPHVHYVVTEYGAVDLYGKSLQERAKLLISIAHPDHRESLDRAAFERFGGHYHAVKI